MPDEWFPGQTATLDVDFKVDGVFTDPTSVTLSVMTPGGTKTDYTYASAAVTRESTGQYSKDIILSTEGVWLWRWVGTGTVAATDEGRVRVKRSEFV